MIQKSLTTTITTSKTVITFAKSCIFIASPPIGTPIRTPGHIGRDIQSSHSVISPIILHSSLNRFSLIKRNMVTYLFVYVTIILNPNKSTITWFVRKKTYAKTFFNFCFQIEVIKRRLERKQLIEYIKNQIFNNSSLNMIIL